MTIILIGAIIAIIGGLIGAIGTWIQNKQSSEKSTRIETGVIKANKEVINLRRQNDSLKSDLKLQLNKIDELRRENTDLYGKLAKSSLKIYNNLTGGEGNKPILIINPTSVVKPKDEGIPSYFITMFTIENIGKYPLKNVQIRISDISSRDLIPFRIRHWVDGLMTGSGVIDKEKEYDNYEFVKLFRIGTIPSKVKHHFYRGTFSPEVTLLLPHYNIEITWDNGSLIHFVTLKIDKEKLIIDHLESVFNGQKTTDNSLIKFE
ncbi:MAG: hypothetical protein KDD14_15405 [Saprospiraceae bacterium]|nr:hypothetical protein [Saprospiraceae bacterium]